MNKNIKIIVVLIAVILVGAVYWFITNQPVGPVPVTGVNQTPVTSGDETEPVEPAAAAARQYLAAKLSVDEKSIVILLVEEITWTDGCLGLGGPAEVCLQALVDGFKVKMLAKGKTYIYRTDKIGTSVRAETN